MALPSPTVSTATVAYTKFTTTRYIYVPTIATQASPTSAEITAGKDVTPQITSVSGFTTSTASLDLPLAGTSFTGNLPGRKTAADSSITFELSSVGPSADIRSIILEGAVAYMVICNEGIVASGVCDIWPIRVGSVATAQDIEAIAMATAQFYTYRAPSIGVTIPTA